jgi:hypothetical protein
MFVYYFVHVPAGFALVERSVLEMLGALDGFAEKAYRDGEDLRALMGIGGDPPLLAKSVRVEVARPLRGGHETTVPLTWEATGTPGLFPRMEADLVIAALSPELTQLSLRGTYRVPFGKIGRAVDNALLHRIAEASVKAFVDRIAFSVGEGVIDSEERRLAATGEGGLR